VAIRDEKLKKQLNYSNKKGIPLVIIIGPDERDAGTVTLKDMRNNEQMTVGRGELVEKVKELLAN